MVCCFAPRCNHKSEDGRCSFYRFPTNVVKRRLWVRHIRRADRKPSPHSRICSCHFPSGKNKAPVLFVDPTSKYFKDHSYIKEGCTVKKTVPLSMNEMPVKNEPTSLPVVEEQPGRSTVEEELESERRKRIELEKKLKSSTAEITFLKDKLQRQSYCRDSYSASQLSESILLMETGMPDKDTFSAICENVSRFEDSITYFYGWRPKYISLEDQILMTLMKLRHNYTNLHLVALFCCNLETVRNVLRTFIEVHHELLFKDISTVPTCPGRKTRSASHLLPEFPKLENDDYVLH